MTIPRDRRTPYAAVLVLVLTACGGATPRGETPVVSKPEAVAATTTGTCAEPTALTEVPAAQVAELLAKDPPAPIDWRRGPGDDSLVDGNRRYAMNDMGAIEATDGGKPLWKVPPMEVAGGGFDIMLSPKGTFLVRLFSRGGLELFDATTGMALASVGDAVPAADDSFVIDVPHIQFGLETWNQAEVRLVPLSAKQPAKTLVKLPLSQGNYPQFGAAACGSALVAVSFPTTELAIYRASDQQKVAAARSPGEGKPTFTRSGGYVVLSDNEEKNVKLFALTR